MFNILKSKIKSVFMSNSKWSDYNTDKTKIYLNIVWFSRSVVTVPVLVTVVNGEITNIKNISSLDTVTKLTDSWYNIQTNQNNEVNKVECSIELTLDVLESLRLSEQGKIFISNKMLIELLDLGL